MRPTTPLMSSPAPAALRNHPGAVVDHLADTCHVLQEVTAAPRCDDLPTKTPVATSANPAVVNHALVNPFPCLSVPQPFQSHSPCLSNSKRTPPPLLLLWVKGLLIFALEHQGGVQTCVFSLALYSTLIQADLKEELCCK